MDKKEAIETLVAWACCSTMGLTCHNCPRHEADGKCKPVQDYEVSAAVQLLQREEEAEP